MIDTMPSALHIYIYVLYDIKFLRSDSYFKLGNWLSLSIPYLRPELLSLEIRKDKTRLVW